MPVHFKMEVVRRLYQSFQNYRCSLTKVLYLCITELSLNLSLVSPLHTYLTLLTLASVDGPPVKAVFAVQCLLHINLSNLSLPTYLVLPYPTLHQSPQLGRQSLVFSLTADAKYVRLLSRRLIHLVAVNSMSITPLLPLST